MKQPSVGGKDSGKSRMGLGRMTRMVPCEGAIATSTRFRGDRFEHQTDGPQPIGKVYNMEV